MADRIKLRVTATESYLDHLGVSQAFVEVFWPVVPAECQYLQFTQDNYSVTVRVWDVIHDIAYDRVIVRFEGSSDVTSKEFIDAGFTVVG